MAETWTSRHGAPATTGAPVGAQAGASAAAEPAIRRIAVSDIGDALRLGWQDFLAAPTQFMARERTLIDEAWPGDVIGIHDRGNLRIGDTLSADGDLEFAGIPRFSPEHFARIDAGMVPTLVEPGLGTGGILGRR